LENLHLKHLELVHDMTKFISVTEENFPQVL